MDKTRAAPSVPVLRLDQLPMADDRTAAYRILREAGPVIRTRYGALLLVDRAAVEFALRHPGLFSSRAAFAVGSPLPLVPSPSTPRSTPATGGSCTRSSARGVPRSGCRRCARWLAS